MEFDPVRAITIGRDEPGFIVCEKFGDDGI